ncbi:hypothetical protein [Agathobaculum hominis]
MENENRLRYLEAVQRIIDRLSNCSFLLKGWAVTLVAALVALAAKDSNTRYALIAYIPVACFWFLDSYYLMMERQFKDLYKENTNLSQPLEDFSIHRQNFTWQKYGSALFSPTQILLYIPLIMAILVVVLCV